jgi:superfamily II DNA or RNA helicase
MVTPWADATPRRWQLEALQAVLDAWRAGEARPLVQACTGAGKSRLIGALAASGRGRVLITTPTQALVEQLAGTIAEHVGAEHVGQAYQHAWTTDRRVVVTCLPSLPRVLDESPEWACWVADEAHRVEGDSGRDQRSVLLGVAVCCGIPVTILLSVLVIALVTIVSVWVRR